MVFFRRLPLLLLPLSLVLAQNPQHERPQHEGPQQRPPKAQPGAAVEGQEPPEEDLSPAEQKVYVLNPLQASKEMKIGAFYMKKGSFKAAARRFEEATRWDLNSADAFFALGDAQSKLGDEKAARDAWSQ